MEIKKYRLKKLYPGLPHWVQIGDECIKKTDTYYAFCRDKYGDADYLKADNVESFSDFFEPIIERTPIGKTSESETYLDGVDSDVFEGDVVHLVHINTLKIAITRMDGEVGENLFKWFKTQQAAEDYVKLQKAIKRAVALDKLTVYGYYVSGAGKCIVKVGNVHEYLSWYTELRINPYDCELSELTQTIALLTKIKEEREEDGN